MAQTNSIAFPAIFDVARNKVSVIEDNASIVNRTKLLILTEPTELYNSIDFGVGLKRHLWQYNNPNQQAIIHDRIKAQLRLHEPCVDPDRTSFSDGLLFTGSSDGNTSIQNANTLKMTIGLSTVFGDSLSVSLNQDQYTITDTGQKSYIN